MKLRHSRVTIAVTLLAVVFMPALGFAFVKMAEVDSSGALGAKLGGLVVGSGWAAYLGVEGQMLAVAQFLAAGFLAVWCFGREFADRTVESLFALPVSRRQIARGKFIALGVWSVATSFGAVAVTGSIGIAAGLEDTSNGIAVGLLQLLVVCLLTSILALTIGLAASIGRGYLPGFGALIGLVAISQVAVLFGSGGWFPFAAPALWSVSWQDASISVSPAQFVLVVATGIAGMWLTITWWTRFEVV
jgi:ABC-2 type transport system permease protein